MGRFLLLLGGLALLGAGCARRAEPTAPPPGGVYRSDDGGITLVQKTALAGGGFLPRSQPREVALTSAEPRLMVLATAAGVFRTTDAAENWTRLPLPARDVFSVDIHPRNPQIFIASGVTLGPRPRGVIFKSLTGGDTWSVVFVAPPATVARGGILRRSTAVATTIMRVAHDPHAPETIWAGTNTGTLLKSTDGGVHWTTRNSFRQPIASLTFSPYSPGFLFVSLGDGRMARSTDGGASFKETPVRRDAAPNFGLPPQPQSVLSLLFVRHPAGTGERILAGTTSGLFQSDDGGETWSAVPLPPTGTAGVPVTSLAASPEGTLWAVSGFVLYSSTDYGATWRTSDIRVEATIRLVVADPSNPRRLYLVFE